jgi:hypothetical protein
MKWKKTKYAGLSLRMRIIFSQPVLRMNRVLHRPREITAGVTNLFIRHLLRVQFIHKYCYSSFMPDKEYVHIKNVNNGGALLLTTGTLSAQDIILGKSHYGLKLKIIFIMTKAVFVTSLFWHL